MASPTTPRNAFLACRALRRASASAALCAQRSASAALCAQRSLRPQERFLHTTSVQERPPYGYSSNVNVERLRNKDKQFFTPGPLDPEIRDFKEYRIDEKRLFTLGPLKVTKGVKESMMLDVSSRDPQFIKTVQFIRSKLVEIGGVRDDEYSAVLLSTNGPTCLESVLQTSVPQGGKVLVLENGTDGQLLAEICERAGFDSHVVSFPEGEPIDLEKVRSVLEQDDTFTNAVMVHVEPSSGVINPVDDVGKLLYFHSPRCRFIVDGSLSFGAIPVDLETSHVDMLVGNAYTCLEGVPGLSFVLVKNEVMDQCRGNCRSLTLDLVKPWEKQMKSGSMSYVPNTHAVLACARALIEFEEEGSVEGRSRRYKQNSKVLREGMAKLGFREYRGRTSLRRYEYDTPPETDGFMVTTFAAPKHENYTFEKFAQKLDERGVVIYQGLARLGDGFRVSTIGQVNPHDVRYLLRQIEKVCEEMGIPVPLVPN